MRLIIAHEKPLFKKFLFIGSAPTSVSLPNGTLTIDLHDFFPRIGKFLAASMISLGNDTVELFADPTGCFTLALIFKGADIHSHIRN